jgi:DNA-binding LytR/AlgR family response regulator
MKDEIIRSLIVEDHPDEGELLKKLLEQHPEIRVIGIAGQASEAFQLTVEEKPELIFLDVELPGKSGIQFLELIQREGLNPAVIFTTAYQSYAIDAIRHSALDYLLKPIDPDELSLAITRYKQQKLKRNYEADLHQLISRLSPDHHLKFNSKKGFVMIDPKDIFYCQADWNYTEIYYGDENKEVVTLNLGKVAEMLPADMFIRINRSTLINANYLIRVDKKHRTCILKKNDKEYPLSLSILNMRRLERLVEGKGL